MLEDKELDLIDVKQQEQISVTLQTQQPKIITDFSEKMDEVKQNVLKEAAVSDDKFVETIKSNVKNAAVELTEVEKKKAKYQGQQVDFEKEKLETEQKENQNIQKRNENKQKKNDWETKQAARQFHYDGVKPIMEFVGINSPMNLIFLYTLAVLLSPLFLLTKIIRGSFGTLISGAADKDRSKAAKGFLWTIICIFALLTLICVVYLFLKWQGIDILANIKLKGGI